jgi:DNA polymerase-4
MTSSPKTIMRVYFHLPDQSGELYEQLLMLLQGITPRVQALPPHTADLDLTGALRFFGTDARALAQLVRLRALALYGVQTTAAAGPSRLISAMAAAVTPPGSITVISPEPYDIASFLRPQPLAMLPGVGPATARNLARYGLHTIGELADAPLLTVQRLLGAAAGRALHARAHGIDDRHVIPQAAPRSASADHAFARDELDLVEHRRAILGLAEQLGARMRGEDQVCRTLTLTCRYADRSTTSRSRSLPEPTAHSRALTDTAYGLYASLGLERARVRSIALRADALIPAERSARQLSLDPSDDKARRIEAAADRARARFGPDAVKPAALAEGRPLGSHQAPRQTPGPECSHAQQARPHADRRMSS